MAFLCVCPEKSLDISNFSNDESKQHPSFKNSSSIKKDFIQGILQSVSLQQHKERCTRILPGGGITIENTNGNEFKIALDNDVISALTGTISNYPYLVKKYLQKDLNLPQNVTLEAIRDRTPISEAELLCKLFYQMGTAFISKLRGKFSFCIYDSKTVRILAARDASGYYPLLQGNLSDNTLFIASSSSYPSDASDVTEIEPGHYKFGWKTAPKKFMNPEVEMKHSAEIASNAADEALAGLLCKSSFFNASGHHVIHHSTHHTKSHSHHRRSYEEPKSKVHSEVKNSRNSLDSQVKKNKKIHNNNNLEYNKKKHYNMSHRADEQTWWRAKTSTAMQQQNTSDSSEELQHQEYLIKLKNNLNDEMTFEFIKELTETLNNMTTKASSVKNNTIINDLCKEKGIASALIITDTQDKIVYVNEKFESDTGYKAHEVMGKNCRFLQSKPGKERRPSRDSREIRRQLHENKTCQIKIVNYRKDGIPVQNNLLIIPIHHVHNSKIIYRVGFLNISLCNDIRDNANDGMMEASDDKLSTKKSLTRSESCGELAKREHQGNGSDAAAHHHHHHSNAHKNNLAF